MRNVVSLLNRQSFRASMPHSAMFSTVLHDGSVAGTLSGSYLSMRGQISIEIGRWKRINWFPIDVLNRHPFSTGFTSVHGERPSAEYAKLRKEALESEFGQTLGNFNSTNVSIYFRFGPFLALYRAATILTQVVKLTLWQFFLQDINARAVKFRETLIRLGPFYIKFGQALSTRPDILPNAYCQELAKLQDKIPPFPTHVAIKSIESQLGSPVSQIFADISLEPVAAASLGQVYKAHLHTGELVAVKVQRPGMPLTLTLDALLFHMIGGQLKRFAKARKDLLVAVNEMVRHMFKEIDYVLEAQNAERFASLYACYPNEWWRNFGIDDLELQTLAIRILSQTCSSSGCERNWSVFERIHTKRRNRLEHKRLNDLVYTHYNLRLKERHLPTLELALTFKVNGKVPKNIMGLFGSHVDGTTAAMLPLQCKKYCNLQHLKLYDDGEDNSAYNRLAIESIEIVETNQKSHTGNPDIDGSRNTKIIGIKVPKIYWKFTRKAVLTMEWIDGIKLTDADRIEKACLNRKQLINEGLYCSLRQLLEEGFFHADPHPGNLVATSEGSLAYFDFGMMGDIPRHFRVGLIQMLVHFVNRDSFGLANDFLSLGFIPEGADIQTVADALQASFDDGTQQSRDFQSIMTQLYDVMYEFNFSLPPDYSLVMRALGSLEGTAKTLDPDFKVVESAYPFVIGRLLADPNPDMRKILRELLIRNNGSIRWNRFERLVMAISEQAASSQDTGANSSDENTTTARAWASFDMRTVVAATEDLFLFILSEKGRRVRIFLVQDIVNAADAFLKEEALPSIFEEQVDRETSEFTEQGQSVIKRLLSGFQSLRRAIASAPEVWIPLLVRMALKTEAHRFSLDVITALSIYWQNRMPETLWLSISRLLHKLDSKHSSQNS